MRIKCLAAVVALAVLALPVSSKASNITFKLLDQNGTTIDGTGLLVLTSPPPSGVLNDNTISSFSVSVTNPYSQVFTFVPGFVTASFDGSGHLTNLVDFALIFSNQESLSLNAGLTFKIGTSFTNFNAASGTIVQTFATPTPEPSSLLLLGTGLLGAVGVARRRISLA